jgi:hypothetical protein
LMYSIKDRIIISYQTALILTVVSACLALGTRIYAETR